MNSLLDFPRKLRISHDLGILRATTVESATSACMDLLWSGRGRRVGRSVSLAAETGRSLSGLLANSLDRFAEHLPAVPSCVGTGRQQVRQGQTEQYHDQGQNQEPEGNEENVRPARGPGLDARAGQSQDRDGKQDSHAKTASHVLVRAASVFRFACRCSREPGAVLCRSKWCMS